MANLLRMRKNPLETRIPDHKDPHQFLRCGTAVAVQVLTDRVNWLSVADGIVPLDPARTRIAPSVLLPLRLCSLTSRRGTQTSLLRGGLALAKEELTSARNHQLILAHRNVGLPSIQPLPRK